MLQVQIYLYSKYTLYKYDTTRIRRNSGDQNLERNIRSLIRWNAATMVVRANKISPELGGHIATFASAATLTMLM